MQISGLAWMPDSTSLVVIALSVVVIAYCMAILRKYVRIVIEVMDNQAWLPENGIGNGDVNPWLGEEVQFRATDGHPISGVFTRGAPRAHERWRERRRSSLRTSLPATDPSRRGIAVHL
jgi:hypothetical protein